MRELENFWYQMWAFKLKLSLISTCGVKWKHLIAKYDVVENKENVLGLFKTDSTNN